MDGIGLPRVDLERIPPPPVAELTSAEELRSGIVAATAGRTGASAATYRLETVSAIAKVDDETERREEDDFGVVEGFSVPLDLGTTRGYEWGSVVHQALSAGGSGIGEDALRQVCRHALVEFDRPVDRRGEPVELEELMALISAVMRSDVWARSEASKDRYTEVPFAVNRSDEEESPDVVEGVIDLVFREADGWVVADYKTDRGDDPDFERRVHQYRAQVDLYASCWEQATGDPVSERILVFTAQGRAERW